ncbi:transglutaminase domain-containing protein [Bacillus aquiflavi]|nr:transglutaminase domain-containing protein [Bacillus aquiflavi]
MEVKMKLIKIIIVALLSFTIIFTTACSKNENAAATEKQEKKEQDKYEKLVKEKNDELELEPLEFTSYREEIKATITNPEYKLFAVNHELEISGHVDKYHELKGNYAWIKVNALDEINQNEIHHYYIPINDGDFKEKIHFYHGDGQYSIQVMLPATDKEKYFYELTSFEVINVNPKEKRDLTYSPIAQEAGLILDNIKDGFNTGDKLFLLNGKIKNTNIDEIMIEVKKETDQWQHVIPVKDGAFSHEIPLFFGKGVHEVSVLLPDKEKKNNYQYGTTLLVDNESSEKFEPIEYHVNYKERGITLESPIFSGEKTETTYQIKGQIDPDAPYAKETTHLYIKSKKGDDEALDIIPIKDYTFDDSFFLRFGPGTYEVTINVPELTIKDDSYFHFSSIAVFSIENTVTEDNRDLLPSRGIQSDAPSIISLANEITKDKQTDREKALAIYEYTAKNVSYDVSKFKNKEFSWDDSALKTLETKTGVCQDYAYLAVALLRASNMEARYVTGEAGDGPLKEDHAWVEVLVDGNWLTMDPTWGAGYVDNDTFVAKYTEEYFDPDKSKFNETHVRNKEEY